MRLTMGLILVVSSTVAITGRADSTSNIVTMAPEPVAADARITIVRQGQQWRVKELLCSFVDEGDISEQIRATLYHIHGHNIQDSARPVHI